MLNFNKISKKYDGKSVFAVNDLNLEIKPGEIFGFLGPNGAGKSTTISMMMGLIQPTSGSITINGKDRVSESFECKKILGFVPDEPLFYEKMTALRYLNFIADLYNVNDENRKEKIEKLSNLFSLKDSLNDQIKNYSHGMKQKLGIIAALLPNPKILVLDEPMVGLDPKSSFILKDLMKHFCKMGGTVFFSTHVMEVAENLCDRVGIINKGKLLFCGSFEELQKGSDASLEKLFLELTNAQISEDFVDEALS